MTRTLRWDSNHKYHLVQEGQAHATGGRSREPGERRADRLKEVLHHRIQPSS